MWIEVTICGIIAAAVVILSYSASTVIMSTLRRFLDRSNRK